ncbi:hypothetical protein KFK09_028944 [Dendrobium nobile]|uniref:Uncharacterized protein n=1 Tax=Dendrobium nobile TaxID=94219 RepID=A0A8T3A960_DENNO|nr:hypothetical protein KFK09_028944 [Dendrobium nobile]
MPAPVGDRGEILLCRRQWATEVRFYYAGANYDSLLNCVSSFLVLFLILFSDPGKGKEQAK